MRYQIIATYLVLRWSVLKFNGKVKVEIVRLVINMIETNRPKIILLILF